MKKFLLIFIIMCCMSELTLGSAWVREKGEFFVSPSFYYYFADKFYDKDGEKRPIGCTFRKKEVQLYGEYGLNNTTTATFKAPYTWLSCGDKDNSGIGDVEIGIVKNLKRDRDSSLSLYGTFLVPTGYSIKDDLRLGYGRLGMEGGISYGLSGSWGFADVGAGYRHYFGYPSDQARGYMTGGLNLYKNLQLYGLLDAQIGLGNGKKKQVGQNIFLETDYKLVQIYVGPRLMLGKTSLLLGYQKVIWGRNTGDGSGFFLGLWHAF
jgi:hypothetical protein